MLVVNKFILSKGNIWQSFIEYGFLDKKECDLLQPGLFIQA